MHEWNREQIEEFKFFARVATHDVYNRKIKLPLGQYDWSNQKLRHVLKRDYGIEPINAEDWSVPRFSGFSHIMRAAAEIKHGEDWWFDVLQKSGESVPTPR
jgi:hypothetical protein